ncbi:hypothetical protein FWC63_00485 [Candidatus Saccharibacteria bacterium]|nr:hypothetical protein [Candidatus Saccharibacteria bacterium]
MHKRFGRKQFRIKRFSKLPVVLGVTVPIFTLAALATAHFAIPRDAQASATIAITCRRANSALTDSDCAGRSVHFNHNGSPVDRGWNGQAGRSSIQTGSSGLQVRTTGGLGWAIISTPPGVTLNPITGAVGTANTNVGVTVGANPRLGEGRDGVLTFRTGQHGPTASINFSQDGGLCPSAGAMVGGTRCLMDLQSRGVIANNTRFNMPAHGGDLDFFIYHDPLFSGTTVDSQRPSLGNGCDNWTISAPSALANRTFRSTITAPQNDAIGTRACTITVGSRNFFIDQPRFTSQLLTLDNTPTVNLDRTAGSTTTTTIRRRIGGGGWTPTDNFTIVSTTAVPGTPNCDWLTSDRQGTNLVLSTATGPAGANNNLSPRQCQVRVRQLDPTINPEAAYWNVIVTQQGTDNIQARIEPSDLIFTAEGDARTFDFQTREGDAGTFSNTVPAPLSPNPVSITFGAGGTGWARFTRTGSSITLTVDPNDGPDERTATLNIMYGGVLRPFDIRQFPEIIAGPGSPDGGEGEAIEVTCDLGPLGWALCPIITGLNDMLGSMYGWLENNFLRMELSFYDTDTPTHYAWGTFRNIANVLFVIFFLVVIFSQVTSIGISNYGIKKMLPEIIVAAVLINLSFFITQAMIDLSNIIGYQIHQLLTGIASQIGNIQFGAGEGGLLGTLALILGIAGTVSVVGMVLTGGFGALFAVAMIFLISALIAIVMLFVILVMRQVGIIILVVIAPLAFAARILPNTARLFNSWWKMFVSLLVVYPACSLVIGAGVLAGTIITNGVVLNEDASAADQIRGIAGMIAMIAPYFAVITIIKGSLGGLGKIGAMVTGAAVGAGLTAKMMSSRAANYGGKKINEGYGHEQRLQAKAAAAKAKADKKTAELTASAKYGKGTFGKLQQAQSEFDQYRSAAEMASASEYDGETVTKQGRQWAAISRDGAIELGKYKEGDINYDRDFAAEEKKALDSGLSATAAKDKATSKLANNRRISSKNGGVYQVGDASYDADMRKATSMPPGAARNNRIKEIEEAASMSSMAAGTYSPGSANYVRDLAANSGVESKLMKSRREQSAKNAVHPDAHSRTNRRAIAQTAINKRDAEQGKEADLALSSMNTASAQGYGADAIANGDYIKATRAIAKLQSDGKVDEARRLTQDYTSSGIGGVRGRSALGQVGKNKETKADAFGDYAYYKYITENPDSTGTIDEYYAGAGEFATNGKSFADDVASGKYTHSYATMDNDTAKHIATADATGDQAVAMLSQMDAQKVGQLGEQNLIDLMRTADARATSDPTFATHYNTIRDTIRDNYRDAGANAATFGYTAGMKSKFGI